MPNNYEIKSYIDSNNELINKIQNNAKKNTLNYKKIAEALNTNKDPKNLPEGHPAKPLINVWHQFSVSDTGLIILDNPTGKPVRNNKSTPQTTCRFNQNPGHCQKTLLLAKYEKWPQQYD